MFNSVKHTKLYLVIFAVLVTSVAAFFIQTHETENEGALIQSHDAQVVARGAQIYAQYCAACHGTRLEGQANWRTPLPNGRMPAPPHDESGHTWHHADELLFEIVKYGFVPGRNAPVGHESDMPAYGGILSDEEILASLAYIKSQWPPEMLRMQKEQTRHAHAAHRQQRN